MTLIFNNKILSPRVCRDTAWKASKYGPETTPYLDPFRAVKVL